MTIGGMTTYELLWYFLLYSFLGWVLEVVYHAVTQGKIINRGFLNGPVCPIYGVGVILIFALGGAVFDGDVANANGAIIFVGGTILATAVELVGGFALDKIFHARWWDYTEEPLNLNGYICVKFSIMWGLAITFVVRVLHPFLDQITAQKVPEKIGWPMLLLVSAFYIADICVTVAIVRGLNKQLAALDDIRASMRVGSDNLSDALGTMSIKTAQRIESGQVQAALAKAELEQAVRERREEIGEAMEARKKEIGAAVDRQKEELADALERGADNLAAAVGRGADSLAAVVDKGKKGVEDVRIARRKEWEDAIRVNKAQWEKLLGPKMFGARRILEAFPNLTSTEYNEALEEVRHFMHEDHE